MNYKGVEIKRLPPGPVPDVPFVDQLRASPQRVSGCVCGARRKFGDGTTGRCGCFAGKPSHQGAGIAVRTGARKGKS